MQKTNVPFKVALGYIIVAIVLILAIGLVYRNTTAVLAINQATRDYIEKRQAADSTMSSLLKEEQTNLQQLTRAMQGKSSHNYLHEKMNSLNSGEDSVVVHSKAPKTHVAKNTTVEVMKTRKGFFRRLADAFKKEHAETLSIRRDSNQAVTDTLSTPVNVAGNVANILKQIDRKEKQSTRDNHEAINREVRDLQITNARLALRSSQQLNDIHQREQQAINQAINQAMQARQNLLWQIGLLAIVAITAAVILVYYIYRDTQKERIYRENLEEANEEIRRIMNQRERLLLTITHDIKAPAASISGFIDLMKDYVDNPQGISCLNSIKGSATHLSRLVAALLDYHQLENGLMKLNPVDFSPADMFRQCAGEMQILSREKGLELHLELDGISSPQTYYRADAFRIRQILNNLVSNAIKYTDKGSVTIQAAISPQHLLTFSVRDIGKGMTTEERQKVFQAFTRLKSAQGIEGTGLGLNITQELVNLLQGTLRLESVKDKGSTFTVTIPLALGTAPAVEEAEEQKPLTPVKPHFENHKILLLDDDPLQLRLLQEMLKKLVGDSWQVFACLHVAEALTVLHNEHPALMMMDIEMPEMNGIRMIQHINHSHMKVVAMTAHDASIIRELKEAGFDDCLFKPFSTEKLKEILGLEDAASAAEDMAEDTEDIAEKTSLETEDIAEKSSLETEDIAKKSNKNSRFAALLTFAEGDPEAEAEILSTVKQELSSHLQNLQQATDGELSIEAIGKTAHKLLPIATMIEMETRQYIAALAPEHISDLSESQIRAYTQSVITDLKGF